MDKKILITLSTVATLSPVIVAVSCGSVYNANDMKSKIYDEYNEQQKSFVESISLNNRPHYKTSGNITIEWNAKQARNVSSDWKNAPTIKNASFYAMDDYIQAYNEQNKTNVNLISKVDYSVEHQKIISGGELPDFIIVDDAGLLEFSKYQYNGKRIFNEFQDSSKAIKPFTLLPLINIIDYKKMDEVLELEASINGEKQVSIFNSNGDIVQKNVDDAIKSKFTIKNVDKFRQNSFKAEQYNSSPMDIYKASKLFNEIEEIKYGTGIDFPGSVISDILHSSNDFKLSKTSFEGNDVENILKSIEEIIGKGMNIKLAGDNNYTTSNFSGSNIVNVVSKGFSLNYLQANKNLIVKGVSGQNDLNGKYLISYDSGDANREELKQEFFDKLIGSSNKVASSKLSTDFNGVQVGSTTQISFDEYYSLWSKGRAVNADIRAKLSDNAFYTEAIKKSFRLSDIDVQELICFNKTNQNEKNLSEIRNNAIFSKSIDLVARQEMDK